MTALRSYLSTVVPSSPTSDESLEQLRARAWAEQGVVVLHVAEISDDWLRQSVTNEAVRRWGRRMKGNRK